MRLSCLHEGEREEERLCSPAIYANNRAPNRHMHLLSYQGNERGGGRREREGRENPCTNVIQKGSELVH